MKVDPNSSRAFASPPFPPSYPLLLGKEIQQRFINGLSFGLMKWPPLCPGGATVPRLAARPGLFLRSQPW